MNWIWLSFSGKGFQPLNRTYHHQDRNQIWSCLNFHTNLKPHITKLPTIPMPSKANNAVPKKRGNSLIGADGGYCPGLFRWKNKYWYVPTKPIADNTFANADMYAMTESLRMNTRAVIGIAMSRIQIRTSNVPNNCDVMKCSFLQYCWKVAAMSNLLQAMLRIPGA